MTNKIKKYIFEPSTRTRLLNPEYLKRREEEYRQGYTIVNGERVMLSTLFGMQEDLINTLDLKDIIGKSDMDGISTQSYENIDKIVNMITEQMAMGINNKFSTVFYLGKHAKLNEFAYFLLSSAYLGGMNVTPLVTPIRLAAAKQTYASEFEKIYLDSDVAVVLLTAGYTTQDIEVIRGYMQQRTLYRKPTIIILGSFAMEKQILLNLCSTGAARLDLGVLASVTYEKPLTDEDVEKQYKMVLEATNEVYGTKFDENDMQFGGMRKVKQKIKTENDDNGDDFMATFAAMNSETAEDED